ncbi:hypothetical protein J6590_104326 [Homalodisca vitripennis]|nr:hypothetical protein J6590_104326 [Homalodisca vitripennis]
MGINSYENWVLIGNKEGNESSVNAVLPYLVHTWWKTLGRSAVCRWESDCVMFDSLWPGRWKPPAHLLVPTLSPPPLTPRQYRHPPQHHGPNTPEKCNA